RDVDLAQDGVKDVTLGVLAVLKVLDKVEGTYERLVAQLQDFVCPGIVVVVNEMAALRLDFPILALFRHHAAHNSTVAEQVGAGVIRNLFYGSSLLAETTVTVHLVPRNETHNRF